MSMIFTEFTPIDGQFELGKWWCIMINNDIIYCNYGCWGIFVPTVPGKPMSGWCFECDYCPPCAGSSKIVSPIRWNLKPPGTQWHWWETMRGDVYVICTRWVAAKEMALEDWVPNNLNKHQHDRHKIQTFGDNFYCRNQPLAGWNQNVTGSLWDSSYGKPLSHLLKLGWCGTQQSYEVRGNENDMMWHANSFEIRYSDSSILMYIYIYVCVYVQHIIVNYPIRGTRLEGSELHEHFVVGWGVSFFTFLHIINCNTKGSKLLVNSINTTYHEVSCVNAICRKFPLSFYHFSGFCRKQDPAVFDIGKGEVIKGSPVGWKTTDMWKGLWLCVSSFIHLQPIGFMMLITFGSFGRSSEISGAISS